MTLAITTYVIPLTTIYRQRVLPAPGKLLVRQGQKVAPHDVVAQTNIVAEHVLLDIPRGLHVPVKRVEKFIERIAGESVSEGDVIATGPKGLIRRVIRAPCDGKIVYIRSGQILLQRSSSPFELSAGYAGVISELIPDLGVIVEAEGALVQGVWGNGHVEFGTMQVVARDPSAVLKAADVDISQRGAILVSAHVADADTLQAMADITVRGLILASMPSSLIPAARSMPFPILLTEGFGRLPMNLAAFRLLTTNNTREVSLNAEAFDSSAGIRPELVIPLPTSGKHSLPPMPSDYAPDQRVRIVRAPYASNTGRIVALPAELHTFANGLRAPSAEVRLDSGDRVVVPMANLEVLEYK